MSPTAARAADGVAPPSRLRPARARKRAAAAWRPAGRRTHAISSSCEPRSTPSLMTRGISPWVAGQGRLPARAPALYDQRSRAMLPNVVIAGAPKCGTTSLFAWLADHPDVCGSNVKEARYFLDPGDPLFDETRTSVTTGSPGTRRTSGSAKRRRQRSSSRRRRSTSTKQPPQRRSPGSSRSPRSCSCSGSRLRVSPRTSTSYATVSFASRAASRSASSSGSSRPETRASPTTRMRTRHSPRAGTPTTSRPGSRASPARASISFSSRTFGATHVPLQRRWRPASASTRTSTTRMRSGGRTRPTGSGAPGCTWPVARSAVASRPERGDGSRPRRRARTPGSTSSPSASAKRGRGRRPARPRPAFAPYDERLAELTGLDLSAWR